MSELSSLEARVDAAISQIRTAFDAREISGAPNDTDDGRVDALQEENATLTSSLGDLKQQRKRDIADLDALIEQLKPLVEGND